MKRIRWKEAKMKILIVSDTHGWDDTFEKVLMKEAPVDLLIHCGDIEGSEEYFELLCECPTQFVRGNNDFYSSLPSEVVFELCGYRIMVTHGHYYGVSMGVDWLIEEAKERRADIVMYGHTHCPDFVKADGMIVLNPGSLSLPRQKGRKPTYMIMEIDEKNNINFLKKVVDK